jgi:hypothetical protein
LSGHLVWIGLSLTVVSMGIAALGAALVADFRGIRTAHAHMTSRFTGMASRTRSQAEIATRVHAVDVFIGVVFVVFGIVGVVDGIILMVRGG